MNVDLGFIEWCIGGILTVGAAVSGYLYSELNKADKEQADKLAEFKTHVAATYSTRSEMKDLGADLKREIRETADDLKDFIKATIKP